MRVIKEFLLNASETAIDIGTWLSFRKDEPLSGSYAERQLGMWAPAFNQGNVVWLNRLHKRLLKRLPDLKDNEPDITQMLTLCKEHGLCSQSTFDILNQYGNQSNGLPLVLHLQEPPHA